MKTKPKKSAGTLSLKLNPSKFLDVLCELDADVTGMCSASSARIGTFAGKAVVLTVQSARYADEWPPVSRKHLCVSKKETRK